MWVYQVLFSTLSGSGSELSGLASGQLAQPGLCPCMGRSYRLRRNTRGALKFDNNNNTFRRWSAERMVTDGY